MKDTMPEAWLCTIQGLCLHSPSESHFRETRGIQKGQAELYVCLNARPPGCCHSAAVPTWKSLTSCSMGPLRVRLCSPAPASSEPCHRQKPKIRTGTYSEGKIQSASRPAQASENFRNCKRGHELKALELARRRKR